MHFSIVIPSRDSRNLLPCVAAIQKREHDPKIMVVDDGLEEIPPRVNVIPGVKPFVFPRAINMGVRASIEAWPEVEGFICCNDDALLESCSGFTLLAEQGRLHPEFGAISATTNVVGNPDQFRRNIGLRETHDLAYVCVYIPRSTFENVQWMDERYCVDYGCCDKDHAMAIKRAGLKLGVFDGCYVDHGSLRSSFRGDPTTPRSFQQNYALYKEKWGVSA